MNEKIKSEVESLLNCKLTDEIFEAAFGYARRKQEYLHERECDSDVMEHWYLLKLIGESVESIVFSKITVGL